MGNVSGGSLNPAVPRNRNGSWESLCCTGHCMAIINQTSCWKCEILSTCCTCYLLSLIKFQRLMILCTSHWLE